MEIALRLDCIESLLTLNIVNGQTDSLFEPEKQVTRAEITPMVFCALNLQEEPAEQIFYDFTQDNWFSSVVNIAAKYEVVEGVAVT
ncbi:S-layer homology domain-containing protein [Paenibacillus periandrae]|uniref:S-layer homology domain-containing protein n=1 Tax=Paenibacillus periandrae TaxID=1761741 RepID=UPI001F09776E|nr:S-layer homology domain-containing protein [Paenibacillus periandrae]